MQRDATQIDSWPCHGAAQDALRSIERRWNEAATPWNPDGLASIYTEDALFYGGRPQHYVGREGVRDYFRSYVGILRSVTLKLVDQHIVNFTPAAFIAQGLGEFGFVLSSGKQTRNELRTTLTIVKRDHEWSIVGHHFSPKPEAPPIPD